jgi:hypothetical protein
MPETTRDPEEVPMPPSLSALLDRTTPEQVPRLDLDDLARRGRRRRHRHRATRAAAVEATLALAGAVVGRTVGSGGGAADVDTARSPGLTEPVGSWSRLADPPFSPRGAAFGGTLSDGRVLVWGGQTSGSDEPVLDGGIYDPHTGQWTRIPAAPLPPLTARSPHALYTGLNEDGLAVVGTVRDGTTTVAAVYDVADQQWYEAPSQDGFGELSDDGVAWDGETLVLVGWSGDATAGPRVRRWTAGGDHWTTGAAPPPGLRDEAITAFDGTRLAAWGTGDTSNAALYHVAEDRWEPLPPTPVPARPFGTAVWLEGRLLVGGGTFDVPARPSSAPAADLAAYDPVTGTWELIDGPPEGGIMSPSRHRFDDGTDPVVLANPGRPYRGDEPLWFLGDDGWEQAPLHDPHRLGDVIVATPGGPAFDVTPDRAVVPAPFDLQVRAERDRWLDAAEPPFESRFSPTVVAHGGQLLVVGGFTLPAASRGQANVQPYGDAWVFDLSR